MVELLSDADPKALENPGYRNQPRAQAFQDTPHGMTRKAPTYNRWRRHSNKMEEDLAHVFDVATPSKPLWSRQRGVAHRPAAESAA
jgi:hypothetical protein